MTAVPTGTLVRPLAESRPPGRTWPAGPPALVPADQPTLDLGPGGGDSVGSRPWSTAVEATLVRSRWCARPSPRLPDARA